MSNIDKRNRGGGRIAYIDVLNIIAILAVLFMHHNGNVHGFSGDRAWATSLVIETVCYFAVPLFLMITGATLLNYREKYDTKTFFKKRAIKIIVPSIAWMLIMFFWHVCIVGDLSIENLTPSGIVNIFTSSAENSVYYYLFVIMGIYLTIPLLSPLADQKHRKTLWYGVIVFFIFNTLIPDLLRLVGVNWNMDFSLRIGGYVVYLFLGHLLSTADIKKSHRIALYIGGVVAILYRYLTTFFMSRAAGTLVTVTWGYTAFHTIILTAAVFVFCKNLPLDKLSDKFKNAIAKLAGCSFGIYLLHMLIMYYEYTILQESAGITPISRISRFICPFLTYIICIGIVLVLKKIPIVKKIVP